MAGTAEAPRKVPRAGQDPAATDPSGSSEPLRPSHETPPGARAVGQPHREQTQYTRAVLRPERGPGPQTRNLPAGPQTTEGRPATAEAPAIHQMSTCLCVCVCVGAHTCMQAEPLRRLRVITRGAWCLLGTASRGT